MTDPKQTDLLTTTKIKPNHLTIVANHVFGTCAMGEDTKWSVVNSDFETHDVRGLYVCDTSIFPTPSGVNPMETALALGDLCARRLKAKYS